MIVTVTYPIVEHTRLNKLIMRRKKLEQPDETLPYLQIDVPRPNALHNIKYNASVFIYENIVVSGA